MKTKHPAGYVAYYRVSTDKQGKSGLGLEAQREAVARQAGNRPILAEYTEIESGKNHANRPQLRAALEHAKRLKAALLIAKLDRLARNVHFISGLMESGVEFVAADLPQANRLTVHIMAAFAEHEREAISTRTKDALAAAKARGARLGNPRWKESIAKARAAKQRAPAAPQVLALMRELRAQAESYRAIAERLNGMGLKAPSGYAWYAATVRTALKSADTSAA
jgi:DNA invertase Pin-like site-specific DNA recombinase